MNIQRVQLNRRGLVGMKKGIIFFWLFHCIACYIVRAQHFSHSDIRISLLTAASGEDIYAVFGHNGLRVKIETDSLDYDAVYNYGTINFKQPNFYVNFSRGRMNYYLSRSSFENFHYAYMYENRRMREQVLELDSAQTMFVFNFLENNYLPENRYYWYHFFYDNCATRIRDLLMLAYEGIEFPQAQETPTFRNLIHRYLNDHPWGRFGIDIGLGLPTDITTGVYEQMFLPDYLFDTFSKLSYNGHPIVKETNDIIIPDGNRPPAIQPSGLITPAVVCCFMLALAALCSFVNNSKIRQFSRFFDFTLFFIVGIAGLLVTFLWFFTDHTNTQNNLNIIWAIPSHIIMAFFLLKRRRSDFTRKYFLFTAIIAMLLIITWAILPQPLNLALIPLVLAIALRAFRTYRFRKI